MRREGQNPLRGGVASYEIMDTGNLYFCQTNTKKLYKTPVHENVNEPGLAPKMLSGK